VEDKAAAKTPRATKTKVRSQRSKLRGIKDEMNLEVRLSFEVGAVLISDF